MLNDEQKVYDIVKSFIERHEISCEEEVYQSDHVIEEAYELMADLFAVVGYVKSGEDEE